MLRIQLDDRAVFLERWQALLVGLLDRASVAQHPARAAMLEQVVRWEARASETSVGYRLVRVFHKTLERRVFEALTLPVRAAHPNLQLQVPSQLEEAVWQLANARPAHLLDPRFVDWREFLLDVLDESLRTVASECSDPTLASCTWGARTPPVSNIR
ncbi:MAG: penicillin acylase family protein [Proteobacteria bacterium]|nr:penicillin acylase family protein [Pseudomonadota bacterium]